jgi:hypothetical protein
MTYAIRITSYPAGAPRQDWFRDGNTASVLVFETREAAEDYAWWWSDAVATPDVGGSPKLQVRPYTGNASVVPFARSYSAKQQADLTAA